MPAAHAEKDARDPLSPHPENALNTHHISAALNDIPDEPGWALPQTNARATNLDKRSLAQKLFQHKHGDGPEVT